MNVSKGVLIISHDFPRTVLITGATGGIGGALAEAYADPGIP